MSWDPVYRFVKKIPRGRVMTYGSVARALRLRGGARAVGYAMAASPNGRGIPWHRVVGAGGRIRVPESHAALQRKLLETEGVAFDGGLIRLEIYAWRAAKRKTLRSKSVRRARKKTARKKK